MRRIAALLPPGGPPPGYLEDLVGRAAATGSEIHALYVVDGVWNRFSSADWLSTGPSRARFEGYMRDSLLSEGRAMAQTLTALAAGSGVRVLCGTADGDPADELAAAAGRICADEVMAPPRYMAGAGRAG